jgi:hypothetical protein
MRDGQRRDAAFVVAEDVTGLANAAGDWPSDRVDANSDRLAGGIAHDFNNLTSP